MSNSLLRNLPVTTIAPLTVASVTKNYLELDYPPQITSAARNDGPVL
jgi:hypothetical protein